MTPLFLGQIPVAEALAAQLRVSVGTVIGFEPERSVITLGVRGRDDEDLFAPPPRAEVLRVDRGGQATLHNPGQLVIFPVVSVREIGARAWVCALAKATQALAAHYGQVLNYDPARPGLYDASDAKVAAIGVRIRGGVSTHGIALNLRNDLSEFAWIRACGRLRAPVAHLAASEPMESVFHRWVSFLKAEVDKPARMTEFECPATIS